MYCVVGDLGFGAEPVSWSAGQPVSRKAGRQEGRKAGRKTANI